MPFDLSDYKTVAERITELRTQYPNARLQSRVVETGVPGYVAVEARCYLHSADDLPGVGLAWEPVPGRTPYTKDSELQNAETSAWGRAIVAALVTDTSKGIASRDEVQHKVGGQQSPVSQTGTPPVSPHPVAKPADPHRCPECNSELWDNRTENVAREARGQKRMPAFKCPRKDECGWKSWDEFVFDPKPVREGFDPADVDVISDIGDPERPF